MTHANVLELGRSAQMRPDLRAPQPADHQPMTSAACVLAYLGAAPLIAAARAVVAAPQPLRPAAQDFLALYGAALLVFFGGVRWGVAVMRPDGPTMRSLLGAVLPMIAALPLFGSGDATIKIVIVMVLMIALLCDDLAATRRGSGARCVSCGLCGGSAGLTGGAIQTR
jgi:hypothetical protein